MESDKKIGRLIPSGEMNCIWAEAGLVSYKLCERQYQCEDCPFDKVMRGKSGPAFAPPTTKRSDVPDMSGSGKDVATARASLRSLVDDMFSMPSFVPLPDDRVYSRNHIWMKRVRDRVHRIGLDLYAAHFLGQIENVICLQPGCSFSRNCPLIWITSNDGAVAVPSPISGRVTDVNPAVANSGRMVFDDPYGQGWVSVITTDYSQMSEDNLQGQLQLRLRFEEQFRQLKEEVLIELEAGVPPLGATLMDGGLRPNNLSDLIGTRKYISFLNKLITVGI